MQQFLTKLFVVFIIVLAFIDGMLVAEKLNEDAVGAEAVELQTIQIEKIEEKIPATVFIHSVPFTIQAPFGWTTPWTDYAEEASILMAQLWLAGETMPALQEKAALLLELGQKSSSPSLSIEDTLAIFADSRARILSEISQETLLTALQSGAIILAPVNGQLLESPYYADPAPEHHMLILIGYDKTEGVFITNDPGTIRGHQLRYEYEKILNAIQDLDEGKRVLTIQP